MELSYGKKELEQIAKLYEIKGAYKMKKIELTEAILEAIPVKMPELLPMLDEEDIYKLEALILEDRVINEDEELEAYYNLMELELAQLIQTKAGSMLCVAGLVKKVYSELDLAPIMKEIQRNSLIRHYVMSILNLYGVVKVSWAVELYNKYYEQKIKETELVKFIKKDMRLVCQCKVVDDYIVEETIYSLDKANINDFIEETTDKDYFIPSKELLINMYSERYYEQTLQVEKLKAHLRKHYFKDEELIEEAIVAVTMIARVDCDRTGQTMEIILEELDHIGVEFKNLAEINELVKHVSDVVSTTRKWIEKGFKPQEVSPQTFQQKAGQKIKVLDIGRNALCPCGSGKKYKKCCGNK